ncbi:cytochrome C [Sphingobium indicum IP26]|uniref:Cytochrome C n=2 Tax=Sphingobium TaxID=165695 RepID=A0A8E0WQ96_9SPHN|nr:cytochrome c family protein [Sphingobium indicum]EPR17486.1 cytochrome C [Sphingobium indicum IP26]KER35429.1 cytochrome C [Sphingobium indicum F2]
MKTWIFAAGIGAVIAGAAVAAPAPKGNAAHGQQLFARCAACHKVGPNPARAMGPSLNGVVGRAAGSQGGYGYSPAMKASGIKWDEASIDKLLQGPSKLVPGTKMIFPGMAAAQDRADIIAYLKQFGADGRKK